MYLKGRDTTKYLKGMRSLLMTSLIIVESGISDPVAPEWDKLSGILSTR